jgi:uracil-DNA glycosylase
MRPLIIGEAPARTGDPRRPLMGRSGSRLAALCGLDLQDYARTFARANVLERWPGKLGKGDAFDLPTARLRAALLRRRFVGGRLVVLLGLRTARAFGLPAAYLTPARVACANVVVLPHPSGINRWWNDPENVRRATRFLRRLAREAR